jgi:plasmid stability protein
MTEVRIRDVDPWIVESLRLRARSHGKSLEGELRELLRQEAMRPKQELADELRQMRGELRAKYGTFSDSAILIREDRDARG